jgi:HlyD family secretion protein
MLNALKGFPGNQPWLTERLEAALRQTRGAAGHAVTAAGIVWRWRTPVGWGLVALAVGWYVGIPAVLGPVVPAYPVVRVDFVQTVVASGHVEAPYRVNVGAQITGIVAAIPVSEGQQVKAGDVLIRLDDQEARAAVVQAESALAQADARLRQIAEVTLPAARETLAQAQATRANAEQTFERASQLAHTGYGTRVALDDARKSLDIARAQERSAHLQVYTNGPGGSDQVMAETQAAQARAALGSAQTRLGYTTVRAPRDGILISRDVEQGNVVQPSNVLMKLSPTGETELVVQIDERNLGVIAVGQKALASADAFPKETFPAEIVYINPSVDLQRATTEVKLRVAKAPAYLRQDMTVSVDVEVGRFAQVLVVQASVLHEPGEASPWVLRVKRGRVERQAVQIGVVSSGKAVILKGLDSGDAVLPATTAIRAGQRVRAQVQVRSAP